MICLLRALLDLETLERDLEGPITEEFLFLYFLVADLLVVLFDSSDLRFYGYLPEFF